MQIVGFGENVARSMTQSSARHENVPCPFKTWRPEAGLRQTAI